MEADGKYILEGEAAKKIGILKIFTNKAEDEEIPFIKGVEVSVTLKPDANPATEKAVSNIREGSRKGEQGPVEEEDNRTRRGLFKIPVADRCRPQKG